jgi:subtilisin family serine protease
MSIPTPVRRLSAHPFGAAALAALLLSACARAGVSTAPAPEPAPIPVSQPPVTVSPPAAAPAPAADSARADWHRLDLTTEGVPGIGSERAIRELLASRTPQREVVVAVIDGGVDTAHTYLATRLWRNPREVAGNGRDDDNNGLVDDVFGWNLLTGRNGEAIRHETFEVTRLYAACRNQPAGQNIPRPPASACDSLGSAYRDKLEEVRGTLEQVRTIDRTLSQVTGILREGIGGELTAASVQAFSPTNAAQAQARQLFLQLAANGLAPDVIADAKKAYEGQYTYGLDTTFAPRAFNSVGSADVTGPDASHGTHVAGIIGAERNPAHAMQGIAPNVRIMALRAVPDGDERDEDVARAIRYAADHGAQIINMSFGKQYSPRKATVDSAVRYAMGKGVLLVHAAGNDGENNDIVPSYPSPRLDDGNRAALWLEVGASSWKGLDALATRFSNYGRNTVDLFAPGEDILSTVPGGGVKREDGTSMAAPVVSGVAALLLAYFPSLTPADVRDIIVQSVRTFPSQQVTLPGGSGQQVPFSALSRTGGLVDAYAAVKLAIERTTMRP